MILLLSKEFCRFWICYWPDAKKHGIKVVYETDDDLLGVEKNSPSFEYVDSVRSQITNFIDNADAVTVTTPNLASKFDSDKTMIIHNYYVNTVFDVKKILKEMVN